jgi:hypothetical protein
MQQGVQGSFNRVSLEEAVLFAKRILKVKGTSEYDDDIEAFCMDRFIKQKNIQDFEIINAEVNVVDGSAEMPQGAYRFLAMRYCGDNGHAYGAYYIDRFWLSACKCSTSGDNEDAYQEIQIVGNTILFKNFDCAPAKVKIAYWGNYTDDDNFPLITQDDITGIAYFAAYQIALMNLERYSPLQVQEWKRLAIGKTRHVAAMGQLTRWQNNRLQITQLQRQVNITLV